MLKSVDKYLLREIASPFGIGLLIYTMTLLLNMILMLSERLISKDVDTITIFKMLLYLMPDLLAFTIPMSILMGVLAGLSRMSTDSEIVAFKTMGIDNWRLLKPIILFSVLGWLLSSWMIMYLAPEGNFRFNQLNTRILVSKSVADIKSRTFNRDFHPYTIYFSDIDNRTDEWLNVFLYSRKRGDSDSVILAERGKFVQRPKQDERFIYLKNVHAHKFNKEDPDRGYEVTFMARSREMLPKDVEFKNIRSHTQLVFPELVKKMEAEPKNVMYTIEFHRKFALPFACIALGFLALSLGISTKKGGKVSGFIISLAIIFVYYSVITAGQNMVMKGILPPFLGIWAADIFLLAAGFIAYYYSSKEKSINWERILSVFDRTAKKMGFRSGGGHAADTQGEETRQFLKPKKVLFVIKIRRFNLRVFNILDIYIVKRLSVTLLFILFSITMVFYIVTIMELVDNLIENEVAFHYLLEYVYYNTPEILKFVLPVSVLTAVLLTFSLMSKNNELIAVQVSGISLYRIALPAIIIGLLLSVGYFFVQEDVAPDANRKARQILNIILKRNVASEHELHKNWIVGDNNHFYFYDHFNQRTQRYVRFNLVHLGDDFTLRKRMVAKWAKWETNNVLVLEDGYERNFKDNNPLNFKEFIRSKIMIPKGKGLFKKKVKDYQYMNVEELRDYISYLEKNKSDTHRYQAQLKNRYAFPLSSLVMVLIAIPFSFIMGKRGTLYGIGLAVGISLIFWGTFGVFTALGSVALLSPFLSAFAPIFLFSAFSIYLFINIKT